MEDGAGGSAGAFVFQSRPHFSLTRARERLVFWSLAALCLTAPLVFAAMGYWMMLPFAGLEIAVLAWAFAVLRRREGDYEILVIDGDEVVLERHAGGRNERRVLNRRWAQVDCACAAPGTHCRLALRSHGRATELGTYLSDADRVKLAAVLRSRLRV